MNWFGTIRSHYPVMHDCNLTGEWFVASAPPQLGNLLCNYFVEWNSFIVVQFLNWTGVIVMGKRGSWKVEVEWSFTGRWDEMNTRFILGLKINLFRIFGIGIFRTDKSSKNHTKMTFIFLCNPQYSFLCELEAIILSILSEWNFLEVFPTFVSFLSQFPFPDIIHDILQINQMYKF